MAVLLDSVYYDEIGTEAPLWLHIGYIALIFLLQWIFYERPQAARRKRSSVLGPPKTSK